ncbi:MAG: hypothetical protein WEB09_02550 [Nitriliruptor sp.]
MATVSPLDPTEDDVELAVAAQRRLGRTCLTRSEDPERSCGACRHYLTPGHELAYCWHPEQRALVDAGWICQAFTAGEPS